MLFYLYGVRGTQFNFYFWMSCWLVMALGDEEVEGFDRIGIWEGERRSAEGKGAVTDAEGSEKE